MDKLLRKITQLVNSRNSLRTKKVLKPDLQKIQKAYQELLRLQEALKEFNELKKNEEYITVQFRAKFSTTNRKRKKLCALLSLGKKLLSKKDQRTVKKISKNFLDGDLELRYYNEFLVQKLLKKHKKFLDGRKAIKKLDSLDDEQRLAVLRDEKYTLLAAAAGSGKTATVAAKIAFLVQEKKKKVPQHRILALAFNRKAKDALKERLKEKYGIETAEVRTFHGFGNSIIYEETRVRPQLIYDPSKEKEKLDFFNGLIRRLTENNPEFQRLLLDYLSNFLEKILDEDDFSENEEFYDYMKNKSYHAIDGTQVKSQAEQMIMNFLIMNSIPAQYEGAVSWATKNLQKKEYRPDFWLPEYDIYIEHWGISRNNSVPSWFSVSNKEYINKMEWARREMKRSGKKLIETYEWQNEEGVLIDRLKEQLRQHSVVLKPLDRKELIDKIWKDREKNDRFINLLEMFIKIIKSKQMSTKEVEKRVEDLVGTDYNTRKKYVFGKMAIILFKEYQTILEKEGKIDFEDMINNAIYIAKANPDKYAHRYDYIFVDEFQDISAQRLDLLKKFVNENTNTKIFCVGDDRQCIYSFANSEVKFFTDFAEYFEKPDILFLTTNYRSIKSIVDLSNKVISHNKDYVRKKVKPISFETQKPRLFKVDKHLWEKNSVNSQIKHLVAEIKNLVKNGTKPNEIMVISRFNKFIYKASNELHNVGINGVQLLTAHRAKGKEAEHVFVLNVVRGTFGFPSEIDDPIVLEILKEDITKENLDDERRVFYVAISRPKKYLTVYTQEGYESQFIKEVGECFVDETIPMLSDTLSAKAGMQKMHPNPKGYG